VASATRRSRILTGNLWSALLFPSVCSVCPIGLQDQACLVSRGRTWLFNASIAVHGILLCFVEPGASDCAASRQEACSTQQFDDQDVATSGSAVRWTGGSSRHRRILEIILEYRARSLLRHMTFPARLHAKPAPKTSDHSLYRVSRPKMVISKQATGLEALIGMRTIFT
jgi:hypothetical protein